MHSQYAQNVLVLKYLQWLKDKDALFEISNSENYVIEDVINNLHTEINDLTVKVRALINDVISKHSFSSPSTLFKPGFTPNNFDHDTIINKILDNQRLAVRFSCLCTFQYRTR